MKKYILALAGMVIMLNAHAQNSKVVSAWNYMQNGELIKGKAAIDDASADENTATKPKTWYYKGLIYEGIGEDTALCSKNPDLYPGVLNDALSAFTKSLELDTKKDYKDQIQGRLLFLKNDFFNLGASGFNKRDFDKAYMGFSNVAKIEDIMRNSYGDTRFDTVVTYYTGLAAMQSKKNDIAKKIFENMIDLTFPTMGPASGVSYKDMSKDVITYLVTIYKEEKDTAKSLEIIQKGINKYPNELSLVIEQLNIYLGQKKYDKAIATINTALAIPNISDVTKKQILFNAGLSYEKMEKESLAENSYKDALAIDKNYYDAAYELGAMYYNKAVKVNDTLNKVPVNETDRYNKLLKKRNDIFNNLALPALETSLPLAPTQKDRKQTAMALRKLYTLIQKQDRVKDMDDIINSIK